MNFDTILALIENDDLEKAIDELKNCHRNTRKLKDVVLVAAWYNEFRSNANLGGLSYEQQVLEKNRIRRSLIELLPEEKPATDTSTDAGPMPAANKNTAFTAQHFFKDYVKQVKLRLFEGASECPSVGSRTYDTKFLQKDVRYIWWEIEVVCLPPDQEVPYELTFFYYDSTGEVMGSKGYSYAMTYPANQTVWLYWWGWGYENPGYWKAGRYRVEIYAENILLASGEFEIV